MNLEVGEKEVNLIISGMQHMAEAAETALESGAGLLTARDRYDIARERDGARLIVGLLTGQSSLPLE